MENLIAGVDEAGKGSLVSDVFAAAVILPKKYNLPGLKDSKKISEKKRNFLYNEIKKQALSYCICSCNAREIEELNILQATMLAMQNAILKLKITPTLIYIDGNTIPKKLNNQNVKAIIKGDDKIPAISAASILAKVERDKKMYELHFKYPLYNFNKNKGYGTKDHLLAIKQFGIINEHRKSFAPIKNMINYDNA